MHQILFQIGALPLKSYSIFLSAGFICCVALGAFFCKKEGIRINSILVLSLWSLVGAFVGARAYYVITKIDYFLINPGEILEVWNGGLVYYGGLFGAGLTAYVWTIKYQQSIWAIGDSFAPGLALAQVFGRFGCFLNGCCYGRLDLVHGVVFPGRGSGLPHLPTQLYEAGFVLLLFVFLLWFKARRKYAGQVFWLFVAIYCAGRFFIEILRGNVLIEILLGNVEVGWIPGMINTAQWISIFGIITALGFQVYLKGSKEISK